MSADTEALAAIAERWTMCMREGGFEVEGWARPVPEAPDGFCMEWRGHVPFTEEAGRRLHRARKLSGGSHRSCERCYALWWASGKRLNPFCADCPEYGG